MTRNNYLNGTKNMERQETKNMLKLICSQGITN